MLVPGSQPHTLAASGRRHDSGQALIEYAILLALLAIGLIAALVTLRNAVGGVLNTAAVATESAGAGYGAPAGPAPAAGGSPASGPAEPGPDPEPDPDPDSSAAAQPDSSGG